MTHDELANNLANTLTLNNRIVFEKVGLGPAWVVHDNRRGIVDVISFRPSHTVPDITIYEVKVSRGDLFGDINSGKYKKYLNHCWRLVFAFPCEIAKACEIPKECGVATYNRDKKTWHFQRRGFENYEYRFDNDMFMTLLISGHFRDRRAYHRMAITTTKDGQ
jgi:hypothetical protein